MPPAQGPTDLERRAKSLESLVVDDSMVANPTFSASIEKGPNIGQPPVGTPLQQEIRGVATLKVGDKITTDDIMPAGSRLKYRSNIATYSTFVFENIAPSFSETALRLNREGAASFVVGGFSYGQGSSREHAAICPAYLGVRCVIAKSMERIHRANLINFGILPLLFKRESDYDAIDEGDELELAGTHEGLETGAFRLKNISKGITIPLTGSFSDRETRYIRAGGKLHAIGGQ